MCGKQTLTGETSIFFHLPLLYIVEIFCWFPSFETDPDISVCSRAQYRRGSCVLLPILMPYNCKNSHDTNVL